MTATTTTATAIILIYSRRLLDGFGESMLPGQCIVTFVDDDDDEVDARIFPQRDRAEARAYAVKEGERLGIPVVGLRDFDAAV